MALVDVVLQPCAWMEMRRILNRTVDALPHGPFDADYPYRCARGLVGASKAHHQASSLCAGLTPAGTYQPDEGGTIAYACPTGAFCPEGSRQPTPCRGGTVGNRTNLASQDECQAATPGYWATAGEQIECPIGFYQPDMEASNQSACRSCFDVLGEHGTTRAAASRDKHDCVCKERYFRSTTGSCAFCPPGSACDALNNTLPSLNVTRGYYRLSVDSADVRRCPDAALGCATVHHRRPNR